MLRCFTLKSATTTTNLPSSVQQSFQENPVAETPRYSSSQPSPTVNLTREYTLAVQTNSYKEIWSKIHIHDQYQDQGQGEEDEEDVVVVVEEQVQLPRETASAHLMSQVLHPNRESVESALRCTKPTTLTRLVSTYFENSEHTTHLCLLLHRSVHSTRSLYAPLHALLDVLPLQSNSLLLTQSHCDSAFDLFLQFDCLRNPFPNPDSDNFPNMRSWLSQLKQQLDRHLHKSRRRLRLQRRLTTGSALCLITTALGVAISAAAIAAHALAALFAAPFFTFLPTNFTNKDLHHIAQLDTAAKGTYVLNKNLDTIDRLVVRLHAVVESDRLLIRLCLERGRDKYTIQEVLKQLHKNYPNFLHQLQDLEEHICLFFASRSDLLQQIHLHQTYNS